MFIVLCLRHRLGCCFCYSSCVSNSRPNDKRIFSTLVSIGWHGCCCFIAIIRTVKWTKIDVYGMFAYSTPTRNTFESRCTFDSRPKLMSNLYDMHPHTHTRIHLNDGRRTAQVVQKKKKKRIIRILAFKAVCGVDSQSYMHGVSIVCMCVCVSDVVWLRLRSHQPNFFYFSAISCLDAQWIWSSTARSHKCHESRDGTKVKKGEEKVPERKKRKTKNNKRHMWILIARRIGFGLQHNNATKIGAQRRAHTRMSHAACQEKMNRMNIETQSV